MSITFMFRSLTAKDFEAMARTADFVDDNNIPLLGIDIDPRIGTPEYETGIPIVDVPAEMDGDQEITPPTLKSGWHCNVRVSGERELEEIDGLEQYDEDGNFLPVSQRTHFGIAFSDNGTVVVDGTTEGLQYANVALIDETTIETPQRQWQ
jgi:hypothetical protein